MTKQSKIVAARHYSGQGSLKSYSTGFVLSVALTLIPFILVINHSIKGAALVTVLIGFALAQLIVQLQFFIHLGHENKPRWSQIMFIFMLFMVSILVIGSLWIMNNLNYHGASPDQTDQEIINDEGIHRQ
jgi:cytochrome o ubiquinol oxidase subunit IV